MLVDPVQQHAETQDVGKQHHLLTGWAGDFAHPLEEIHCGKPFLAGQLHLAREIVEVLHQAVEHLPEALIGRRVEGPLDGLGDGLFVQVG